MAEGQRRRSCLTAEPWEMSKGIRQMGKVGKFRLHFKVPCLFPRNYALVANKTTGWEPLSFKRLKRQELSLYLFFPNLTTIWNSLLKLCSQTKTKDKRTTTTKKLRLTSDSSQECPAQTQTSFQQFYWSCMWGSYPPLRLWTASSAAGIQSWVQNTEHKWAGGSGNELPYWLGWGPHQCTKGSCKAHTRVRENYSSISMLLLAISPTWIPFARSYYLNLSEPGVEL